MEHNFKFLKDQLHIYNNAISDFSVKIEGLLTEYSVLYNQYHENIAKYEEAKLKSLQNLNQYQQQETVVLEDKKGQLLGEVNRYHMIFEEGETKFGKITPEIEKRIIHLREAVLELISGNRDQLDKDYQIKLDQLEAQFAKVKNQLTANFDVDADGLVDEMRMLFERELNSFDTEFNKYNTTKDEELIHDDISVFSSQNYSPLIEIGNFIKEIEANGIQLARQIKHIIPFLDCKSVLIVHDDKSISKAEMIQDILITRALLSNEVGKIRLTLTDLKGLGEFFKEFIPLTHEIVEVANGKANLEKILNDCNNRLQEVSIKYTASSKYSDFESIGEYNFNKILNSKLEEIVPHYISVILNLSYDADESLVRNINRLVTNGARNGTQFIILWNKDDNQGKNQDLLAALISNKDFEIVDFVAPDSKYVSGNERFVPNSVPLSKKHELVDSYNSQFKEIVNKVIKEYFKNAMLSREQWFTGNASEAVSVPVGKSKQHRGEQCVDLATGDTKAHIMLSGGTGSGKTNFLKTFITSAAIQYSPDDLEFYLVDLKSGIGFDIFRRYNLPHVKMFAMGAENELIANLLDELVNEMNRRFTLFTKFGVDDLGKYNRANPENKIKRTILIIDEFATIFEEEGIYQDQILECLLPLVKKARAAGINLFLSTQNFNHVSHFFTKLKSEIPIRIVLKSSFEAAAALLEAGNDAMKYVKTIGDGVINYASGVKLSEKDNEFFKAYLLDNEDLEGILEDIKTESERKGYLANLLKVYDNAANADIGNNPDVCTARQESRAIKKIPLWIGEYTTISDKHFKIDLEKNHFENIFITGINKNISINAVYNIVSSLAYVFAPGEMAIRFFSFLNEDENQQLLMGDLDALTDMYDYKLLTYNAYKEEIQSVYKEFKYRYEKNEIHAKRIFLFFTGMEKARDFFKVDNYTLSTEGQYLSELLELGNAYNIHTIIECRQPSVLSKIFKSEPIHLFKHRVVFHLGSSDESEIVLENRMASGIFRKDVEYTQFRAIYYNADYEKNYIKIKPYLNIITSETFLPFDDSISKGVVMDNKIILNYAPSENDNNPGEQSEKVDEFSKSFNERKITLDSEEDWLNNK